MTTGRKTTKTSITPNERLQLIGLLTLAAQHNTRLKDIEKAMQAITTEVSDGGHTMDAMYSDYDVDELLRRLSLVVEE